MMSAMFLSPQLAQQASRLTGRISLTVMRDTIPVHGSRASCLAFQAPGSRHVAREGGRGVSAVHNGLGGVVSEISPLQART